LINRTYFDLASHLWFNSFFFYLSLTHRT